MSYECYDCRPQNFSPTDPEKKSACVDCAQHIRKLHYRRFPILLMNIWGRTFAKHAINAQIYTDACDFCLHAARARVSAAAALRRSNDFFFSANVPLWAKRGAHMSRRGCVPSAPTATRWREKMRQLWLRRRRRRRAGSAARGGDAPFGAMPLIQC